MKQKLTFKNLNFSAGFSLVESLVAITILLLAIAGPLTLAHQSLSSSKNIKNQTTAIFLAQDAMEFIKNLRDQNALTGNPWLDTIDTCSSKCTVDTVAATIHSVCNTDCPNIRFDDDSGLYGHDSSWDTTIFNRTVLVNAISATEASVIVDVSWGSGLQARSFSVTNNIFDWHE